MSNIPAHLLAAANAAVEAGTEADMTQASKGGGGGKLYPEGYAFARLVEVIELGSHSVMYMGQAKDPAPQFMLGFALWGEGYQNEDGTPGYIRTFELSQSTNEKAKAFKLFKKLNWKGVSKTFAQLLGETFLLKIIHTKKKDDPNAKPRSNIDLEGFLPPLDPVTKAPYAIPDAPGDMFKLFLWNHPTQAMWDSLYIEGQRDDGSSKNWLQERICSATNFPGSALENLLHGSAIPTLATPAVPSAPVVPTQVPAAPVVPSAPKVDVPFDGPYVGDTAKAPVVPQVPGIPSVPKLPGQ